MKPGASLVLGETDPELRAVFLAERPGETFVRDIDFACDDNIARRRRPPARPAHARARRTTSCTSRCTARIKATTPRLHSPPSRRSSAGRWRPSSSRRGSRTSSCPGGSRSSDAIRFVVLDGAHNPAGADVAAEVVDEEFSDVGERIW